MLHFDFDYNVWRLPLNADPSSPPPTLYVGMNNVDKTFRLTMPDFETITVEQQRTDTSSYGSRVWYCSVVAIAEMRSNPTVRALFTPQSDVLELGPGCGLCSVAVARMPVQSLALVDSDEQVLELCRTNVASNGVSLPTPLEYIHSDFNLFMTPTNKTYDVIFASDIVYQPSTLVDVQTLLRQYLKPETGVALLWLRRRGFNYVLELKALLDAYPTRSSLFTTRFPTDVFLVAIGSVDLTASTVFQRTTFEELVAQHQQRV